MAEKEVMNWLLKYAEFDETEFNEEVLTLKKEGKVIAIVAIHRM